MNNTTVLILTPVKNAVSHFRGYFNLLHRLDSRGSTLSIGFLESDSSDGTYEALAAAVPSLGDRFERVTLLKHDFGFHLSGSRWAMEMQRRRREVLARSRNRLISGALRNEDWVLWLDVDLMTYPINLLAQLLNTGRDIVVPLCVTIDGSPYDLNTFCFALDAGGKDHERYLRDGIFQPPRGVGRLYLDHFQDRDLVPVDSVGGTVLLVRADLFREGLSFPPYSYKGYIETEGLAMMARDMGSSCWGLPKLRVVHAPT